MATIAPVNTNVQPLSVPRQRNRPISPGLLRTLHANVSAFIAPMVLFFSLSGALQILDLHEAHGTYVPNPAISAISRLHKQQVFAPEPLRKPPFSRALGRTARPQSPDAPRNTTPATLLLKWLFVSEALALATTTLFGAWIGVTHAKRARTCWLLLAAGTIIPLSLVLLQRTALPR